MFILDLGGFTCYFAASFPVMSINYLDKRPEVGEVVRFAYTGDLILDSGRKSLVELSSGCDVTPLDLSCKMVEFNEVFDDIMHPEVLNF